MLKSLLKFSRYIIHLYHLRELRYAIAGSKVWSTALFHRDSISVRYFFPKMPSLTTWNKESPNF